MMSAGGAETRNVIHARVINFDVEALTERSTSARSAPAISIDCG
jgi:hypothetical protein